MKYATVLQLFVLSILVVLLSVHVFAADQITSFNATISDSTFGNVVVTLDWSSTNLTDFTEYVITRKKGTSGFSTIASLSDQNTITFDDSTVTSGTYIYQIYSTNSSGFKSNTVGKTIEVPEYFYNGFSSLTVTSTSPEELDIAWTSDQNTLIKELTLYRYEGGGLDDVIDITSRNTLETYVDSNSETNVLEEREYEYRIKAVYENGEEHEFPEDPSETVAGEVDFSPRINSQTVIIDRAQDPDEITVSIEGTDVDTGIQANLTYVYDSTTYYPDIVTCDKTGSAQTCDFFLDTVSILSPGNIIDFTVRLYQPNGFSTTKLFSTEVTNEIPVIDENTFKIISITDETPNKLLCSYTATDPEGDSLSVEYAWYIQNEGAGNGEYYEIVGETTQYLVSPIYDTDDNVQCSIRVTDASGGATNWTDSPILTIGDNIKPRIYDFTADTTADIPAQVGDSITFSASVIDSNLEDDEPLTVNFCREIVNPAEDIESLEYAWFGNTTDSKGMLWIFTDSLDLALKGMTLRIAELKDEGGSPIDISKPIYDFYIYETDAYGEIPLPTDIPFTKDEDNIFVGNNVSKTFYFDNARVAEDKYMAIKICVNSNNDVNGSCTNEGGSYKIGYNPAYNQSSGALQYKLKNTTVSNHDFTDGMSFSSGNVLLKYGFDSINDSCGNNLFCSGQRIGEQDTTITCNYVVTGDETAIQNYIAYAVDDQEGGVSRTVNGTIYVNHPPEIEESTLEIYKINTTQPNITYIPSAGIALVNETLLCEFTVLDEDPDWKINGINYSVVWQFKQSEDSFWRSTDNDIIFGDTSIKTLAYGNTQAGDRWRCVATPRDQFVNGTAIISESVLIIENSSISSNRPTINFVENPDSDELGEEVYVGGQIDVTVEWSDTYSDRFVIYVCGDTTAEAAYGSNGCLINELYRSSEFGGVLGKNVREISFDVPSNSGNAGNPYTVVVCDEFSCSENTSSAEGIYYTAKLRENIEVDITDSQGNIFPEGVADIENNLICNFSYYDGAEGISYTQENLSYLINNEVLVQRWLKNTTLTEYETVYTNTPVIGNTFTTQGTKWICQIEFIDAPNPQQTSSDPLSIQDISSVNSEAPIMSRFVALQEDVDAGKPYLYRIEWSDVDSSTANLYLCNSSRIITTGCQDTTFNYTLDVEPGISLISYTTENIGGRNLTAYAAVCDLTSCTERKNTSVSVNNRPSASNVEIIKTITNDLRTILECSYTYENNQIGNQEAVSSAMYEWIILDSLGNTIPYYNNTGAAGKTVDVTGETGQAYCRVKTVATTGVKDIEFQNSNIIPITDTTYSLFMLPYEVLVSGDGYMLKGIANSENTTITGYVYKTEEIYTINSNSTKSFSKENPILNDTTLASTTLKNNTIIKFLADSSGSTLSKLQKTSEKYLKFSNHNRSNQKYYNYSIIPAGDPTFIFVNLTTPLEQDVISGEVVTIHRYENTTGYFELEVDLFQNTRNTIKILSTDGGVWNSPTTIYYDTLRPEVEIISSSANANHLMKNGFVTITMNDSYLLNTTYLNISFEKDGVIQTLDSVEDILENLTILPIRDVEELATSDEKEILIQLGESINPGTYIINVTAKDLAGNVYSENKTFVFENQKVTVKNVIIQDRVSGSTSEINSPNITVTWTYDPININTTSLSIYKTTNNTEVLQETILTNQTSSNATLDLEESSCFTFKFQTLSTYGVLSQIVKTACIQFVNKTAEITNVSAKDAITDGTEQLRSNKIDVEWQISNINLLKDVTVSLKNNVTGYLENITLTNKSVNTKQFIIDDLTNNTCYSIEIFSETVVGNVDTVETACIPYFVDDNLVLEIESLHSTRDLLIFNKEINFTVLTYNIDNFTYEIKDVNAQGVIPVSNSTDTYIIIDESVINFSRSSYSLRNTFYELEIIGYGENGDTINKTRTIIFDEDAPQIINASAKTVFNNSEEIIFWVDIFESYLIKDVVLIENSSGTTRTIEMSLNSSGGSGNPDRYKGIIEDLIPSNTEFDIQYYITDYAENFNSSTPQTITINNRVPHNPTNLTKVYWNKTSFYNSGNLRPYFIDLDQDVLSFKITNTNDIDGSININNATGILTGNMLGSTQFENNFTLNVTDRVGATLLQNMTLYALNDSCLDYASNNSVFVGFTDDCRIETENEEDEGNDIPPPVVIPNPGNGGGSGGGSSSGGGSGIGIVQPLGNSEYHKEVLIDIKEGSKNTFNIDNDLALKNVEFAYTQDLNYATLEIKGVEVLPTYITIPGEVYKIIEISSNQLKNQYMQNVVLQFEVPKNNPLGINKENAIVYRWTEGILQTYPLNFYSEDPSNIYFRVSVPGFSYWIISKDPAKGNTESGSDEGNTEPVDPVDEPSIVEPVERPSIEQPQGSSSNSLLITIIWGVVGMLLLGSIISGVVYVRQKTSFEPVTEDNKEQPVVDVNPLPEYIKRHLKKGIIKEKIYATLLDAGWEENKIIESFEQVEKEKEVDMSIVDHNIVEQAQHLSQQGLSKREIEEELESRHIPQNIVQTNVKYMYEVSKLEKEIKKWVENGYTKDQIKEHLVNLGWPTITIYTIMKKYK